jgi:hypothetical protein
VPSTEKWSKGVFQVSEIFDPIIHAHKVEWREESLHAIALAMQAWCDDGRIDKLTGILLKKYVYKPRLGPAKPGSRREPPPVPPSESLLVDCRFELRTACEVCAAREVASAHAIKVLGSDETTKNGNASITSNVLIQPTPGADFKLVVLRGAYCSAGGTAEAIADAIETKCFARLRDQLVRWEAMCLRLYPGYKWTGPSPKLLSMSRLAGGGAIQGDTCNILTVPTWVTQSIKDQKRTSDMLASAVPLAHHTTSSSLGLFPWPSFAPAYAKASEFGGPELTRAHSARDLRCGA